MESILNNIRNKIKKLNNNQKFLLIMGSGLESFVLSLLLKEHFQDNLHCVLINTIYIDEKDIQEIMYQYYYHKIKTFCIDSRKFFYKSYIMENDYKLEKQIISKFNKILNNYQEYITDDIQYFSFAFTKNNLHLKKKIKIQNKISFEPFIDKDIEDLIILYSILFEKKEGDNFFINRKDYWINLNNNK